MQNVKDYKFIIYVKLVLKYIEIMVQNQLIINFSFVMICIRLPEMQIHGLCMMVQIRTQLRHQQSL